MTETLKSEITGILTAINELSAKSEDISSRAIAELPKEDIELGIHMMDITSVLKKAKTTAERTGWCLDKH